MGRSHSIDETPRGIAPGPPRPDVPRAEAVRVPPGEPAERTSGGERAMLVVVGVLFFVLFLAAIVLPHTPIAAAW